MDKSAKYTEEQRKYFEGIIQDISQHKDFGKRNPVDIGIECGYPEDVMLELIQMLYTMQNAKTNVEGRDIYYFLMMKEDRGYVVSVNINDWSTKIIKEVTGFQKFGDIFQIKGNIFAYRSENDKKKLMWENLETKEKGNFLTEEDIENILISKNGIIVTTFNNIINFSYTGETREKEIGYFGHGLLIENDDKIYVGDWCEIYKIDKDFIHKKEIIKREFGSGIMASQLLVAGVDKGEFYCYEWKEVSTGWFSTANRYGRFVEKSGWEWNIDYSLFSEHFNLKLKDLCCLEGITTKKYTLYQRQICARNGKHICPFNRKLDKYTNHGQVVGIFEKDIFIGVAADFAKDEALAVSLLRKEDSELADHFLDDAIIKIDLRNERKPVVLPIKWNSKA